MITKRTVDPRPHRLGDSNRGRAFLISVSAHAAFVAGATMLAAAATVDATWSASSALPSRSSLWAEHAVAAETWLRAPALRIAPELAQPATALVDPVLPPPGQLELEDLAEASPIPPTRPKPSTAWLERIPPTRPARAEPAAPPPELPDDQPSLPDPAPTGSGLVQPSPIASHNPPPRYPFVAWRHGVEGTVAVILEIDADGKVTAAHVETSSGSGQLDDAALLTLRSWRFEPARQGARAVRGTWRQVVVFRLTSATGELTGSGSQVRRRPRA